MKVLFPFIKNKKGFSLVETMVVSGILGGLALVISQMIVMQKKQSSKAEVDYARLEVQRAAVEFLKTKEVCNFMLSSSDAKIKAIRTPVNPVFQNNSTFPYNVNFTKVIASLDSSSTPIFEVGKSASALSEILKVKKIYFSLRKYSTSFPSGEMLSDFTMEFESIKGKVPNPIILKNIQIKALPISKGSSSYKVARCGLWDHNEYQRYSFSMTSTKGKEFPWTVPDGVTRIFVSMSGGGSSGYGWKITDDLKTGHTGGVVMNKGLKVNPGEVLLIKVGYGGKGIKMNDRTSLVTPYKGLYLQNPRFIYSLGDPDFGKGLSDTYGMRGFAGGSSYIRLNKPGSLPIIECSGGHGAYPESGKFKEAFTAIPSDPEAHSLKSEDYIPYLGNDGMPPKNIWQGFRPGRYVNSNNGPTTALPLGLDFAKPKLAILKKTSAIPTYGECADASGIIGTGEMGNTFSDFAPGFYNGGDTSLGYGNGGDVRVYNGNVAYNYFDNDVPNNCPNQDVPGCANGSKPVKGRLILPQPGRDGIVYIDVW